MPELGFAGRGAVVDVASGDQAPADAAAEGHVKDRVKAGTGSACNASPTAPGVGVVLHNDWRIDGPTEPLGQLEVLPSIDLVRSADGAGSAVHRPAEPHADRPRRVDRIGNADLPQSGEDLAAGSALHPTPD